MLKLPHIHPVKVRPETVKRVIFTTIRIGGPIATALLGIEAGKKVQKAKVEMLYLEDPDDPDPQNNGLYFEDLTRTEQFKVLAPKLIPPIAMAGVTIAAACIDKKTDLKRIAEMTSLYSTALASSQIYRKKLEDKDPEAAKEADKEVGEHLVKAFQSNDKELVEHAKGVSEANHIFIDTMTGRQFLSSVEAVEKAISRAKEEYANSEAYEKSAYANDPYYHGTPTRYLGLNDFYDLLGIRETYYGQMFGYIGQYEPDTGQWEYTGEDIDIYLVPSEDDPNVSFIAYGTEPIEGWYEI